MLSQSKERKDAAPRYCERHKLHYIIDCPYCALEKGEQTKLELLTGKKVMVEVSD